MDGRSIIQSIFSRKETYCTVHNVHTHSTHTHKDIWSAVRQFATARIVNTHTMHYVQTLLLLRLNVWIDITLYPVGNSINTNKATSNGCVFVIWQIFAYKK